jgi:ACS family hexuronate transporter-like MFS transporter
MAENAIGCKVGFPRLNGPTVSAILPRMNSPTLSRPAASNFRWVICALLFFSTTVNYMDRQVVSYLKEFFCTKTETDVTFNSVARNAIDVPKFIQRLNDANDPVSSYLRSQLTAPTVTLLGQNWSTNIMMVQAALANDLNSIIQSRPLYDAARFGGVKLRVETQQLAALNPSGDERAHLNRLLLHDAYPQAIGGAGFGWSNTDYANLIAWFTLFYAGITVLSGWVIDRIGTKLGLAISLIIWSIFGIANAFVGSATRAHIIVRSLFGIGEAGNFPASIKTVAEWFPKRERALATGIFNSGSNFGAMIAALFVPWCLIHFGDDDGWKMAFILTGAIGFLWLIFWFWLYDTPLRQKRLSQAEYDYIHIDDETAADHSTGDKTKKVSWGRLFGYRQTWAFFFGKFMTDGVWWFYLFWLPDYLTKQFSLTKHEIMLPTFIVYGIAIVGSVYGGSIPMTLIKRGMPVYKARMTAMLIIAVFPLAVLSTQFFGNVSRFGGHAEMLAIAVICIGCAAHQAWSANLFTTVSDMFPKKAVGSVTGIGAMAGGLGGVLVQKVAGYVTDSFKDNPQTAYLIMFIVCALSYLLAWAIMKALVPRHKPITDL